MSKSLPKTDVPWADRQWPILRGCSAASEGCENCYGQAWHHRFAAHIGVPTWGKPHFLPENLHMPRHTRKPSFVFVAPMSDFFHESCEPIWQDRAGLEMAKASNHTFILLTKRPQNIARWVGRMIDDGLWPMPNVWLGVTAENQARADERVPLLLSIPAAVRFVSVEPMLEPVSLRRWLPEPCAITPKEPCGDCEPCAGNASWPHLSWCIAGPETGRGARPCKDAWIDDLAAESPCFFDKRKTGWTRREWPARDRAG